MVRVGILTTNRNGDIFNSKYKLKTHGMTLRKPAW